MHTPHRKADASCGSPQMFTDLEALERAPLDVLVIGSGPAGTFFTQRLFERCDATDRGRRFRVGVLERGSILSLGHINNQFPNGRRRQFIDCFKVQPWEGDFSHGGMILPALGGRGIAAGAHLRRFDPVDFGLWSDGQWPEDVVASLPGYYEYMERVRRVSATGIRGPLQTWAMGLLQKFGPHTPPVGVDTWSNGGFEVGRGVDSPAFHLWKLLLEEHMRNAKDPRLAVALGAIATSLKCHKGKVTGVVCRDIRPSGSGRIMRIEARHIVLAASTIESARVVLNAGLATSLPAVGRYLAEHVERRAKIEIAFDPADTRYAQGISLVLPPPSANSQDRYQVHLRGEVPSPGRMVVDVGGFAAVDPQPDNRVTLAANKDAWGIRKAHTRFSLSLADEERTDRMCERIMEVGALLGGKYITKDFPLENTGPTFTDANCHIQVMDKGRSYHESGTLRMGVEPETSVTDTKGRVHGIKNLWVADASLFPCVGIANPMLTIGALASRVADSVCDEL